MKIHPVVLVSASEQATLEIRRNNIPDVFHFLGAIAATSTGFQLRFTPLISPNSLVPDCAKAILEKHKAGAPLPIATLSFGQARDAVVPDSTPWYAETLRLLYIST